MTYVFPALVAAVALQTNNPTVDSFFIESYHGGYFNIGHCHRCCVYEQGGKWWLLFESHLKIQYYLYSYETKEEAEIQLKKLIKISSYQRKE